MKRIKEQLMALKDTKRAMEAELEELNEIIDKMEKATEIAEESKDDLEDEESEDYNRIMEIIYEEPLATAFIVEYIKDGEIHEERLTTSNYAYMFRKYLKKFEISHKIYMDMEGTLMRFDGDIDDVVDMLEETEEEFGTIDSSMKTVDNKITVIEELLRILGI